MNIVYEDLWKVKLDRPTMIVVTTNTTIKRDGALVMGRGAALQAKTKDERIPFECGRAIVDSKQREYGFLQIRSANRPGKAGFGIFQVKYQYNNEADTKLIDNACSVMRQFMDKNPSIHIRMNFPGIGNGRLSIEDVAPILYEWFERYEPRHQLTVCLKPPAPEFPLCNWCGERYAWPCQPCESCRKLT